MSQISKVSWRKREKKERGKKTRSALHWVEFKWNHEKNKSSEDDLKIYAGVENKERSPTLKKKATLGELTT